MVTQKAVEAEFDCMSTGESGPLVPSDGAQDFLGALESGEALLESLRKAKADVEASLPGLIAMRDEAKAGMEEGKQLQLEAASDAKTLNSDVRQRMKDEGLNPAWSIVGGLIMIAGGGRLAKLWAAFCKVRDEAQKWKESFAVLSTAVVDDPKTGKASAEVRARINEALAAASINDGELEERRLLVQKEKKAA